MTHQIYNYNFYLYTPLLNYLKLKTRQSLKFHLSRDSRMRFLSHVRNLKKIMRRCNLKHVKQEADMLLTYALGVQ